MYIFYSISQWILLRMRNVSDSSCRENQNTHFMFDNFSLKIVSLWDNVEKYVRAREATDDNIIWHMCFACWVTKATDTHIEYLILVAFPRQQWLLEHVSMLCYTCIACLVFYCTGREMWSVKTGIWSTQVSGFSSLCKGQHIFFLFCFLKRLYHTVLMNQFLQQFTLEMMDCSNTVQFKCLKENCRISLVLF
jgi:hypothetical protein